jgi:PAS domain S-box-containing protein
MDIKLAGKVDGIEAASRIRERHDVPVVYLTAYADENTLNRAKVTQPHGYLVKPSSDQMLRTTIELSLYRHQQERSMRESVGWLARTLNVLGEAVIVTDRDGVVKHMNYVAETLTGWGQQAAVGKHFTEVYALRDAKTGGIMDNPIPMPLRPGVVSASSHHVLLSRSNTEINIEQNVFPVTDGEGDFNGVILAFQDVSQQGGGMQSSFGHGANLYVAAALYCSEGEYSKAESLYKRALLLMEKHLGSDHPKVANILLDLADVCRKVGKTEEAAAFEARVASPRRIP